MKSIFFYLLQVIVVSAILHGYYYLALRNKKFHHYNRFYLLSATAISILIPFLNIPVYFTGNETNSSFVLQTLTVLSSNDFNEPITQSVITPPRNNSLTLENLLYILYILVSAFAFIRILFSFQKIRQLAKNNPIEEINNIHFVNTNEPGTPFSFFRWLFWNRKIELRSQKGEQIFRHELFHIEQKHSWDILYMELLTIVFWINPFFHLIKKEIKAIHEFLADRFAINENNKWEYAELLLMQALNTQQHLVNPFFNKQIKRRIAMITSSQKPGNTYLSKLMVLPLLAIIAALFGFAYKQKKSTLPSVNNQSEFLTNVSDTISEKIKSKSAYFETDNKIILESDSIIWKENPEKTKINSRKALLIINGKKTDNDILSNKTVISKLMTFYPENNTDALKLYGQDAKNGVIIFENAKVIDTPPAEYYKKELNPKRKIESFSDNKIFEKVEIEPSFPGGVEKWKQYLSTNADFSIPLKRGALKGDYTVVVQFIVDKEGSLHDIKALTHHGYGMEEEAMRLISKGPKWVPAIQNGRQVKAYKMQVITFAVEKPKNETSGAKDYNNAANWNYNDPSFRDWRQKAISEIKAIARNEEKAAYIYKGRTYIFANNEATNFTEMDGTNHPLMLNGKLVSTVDKMNSLVKRQDVKEVGFISKEDALRMYNIDDYIATVTTR
jgi:beta-lactamase regulating signal transducer with metallopeptidase domain